MGDARVLGHVGQCLGPGPRQGGQHRGGDAAVPRAAPGPRSPGRTRAGSRARPSRSAWASSRAARPDRSVRPASERQTDSCAESARQRSATTAGSRWSPCAAIVSSVFSAVSCSERSTSAATCAASGPPARASGPRSADPGALQAQRRPAQGHDAPGLRRSLQRPGRQRERPPVTVVRSRGSVAGWTLNGITSARPPSIVGRDAAEDRTAPHGEARHEQAGGEQLGRQQRASPPAPRSTSSEIRHPAAATRQPPGQRLVRAIRRSAAQDAHPQAKIAQSRQISPVTTPIARMPPGGRSTEVTAWPSSIRMTSQWTRWATESEATDDLVRSTGVAGPALRGRLRSWSHRHHLHRQRRVGGQVQLPRPAHRGRPAGLRARRPSRRCRCTAPAAGPAAGSRRTRTARPPARAAGSWPPPHRRSAGRRRRARGTRRRPCGSARRRQPPGTRPRHRRPAPARPRPRAPRPSGPRRSSARRTRSRTGAAPGPWACVSPRGKRTNARSPSPATRSMCGPPGNGRPSTRATLSKASPAASSMVAPSGATSRGDVARPAAARSARRRPAAPSWARPAARARARRRRRARPGGSRRTAARPGQRQRLGRGDPDQQRPGQAGPGRHRDRVDVGEARRPPARTPPPASAPSPRGAPGWRPRARRRRTGRARRRWTRRRRPAASARARSRCRSRRTRSRCPAPRARQPSRTAPLERAAAWPADMPPAGAGSSAGRRDRGRSSPGAARRPRSRSARRGRWRRRCRPAPPGAGRGPRCRALSISASSSSRPVPRPCSSRATAIVCTSACGPTRNTPA